MTDVKERDVKEVVADLLEVIADFRKDCDDFNNKAAARRCRNCTNKLRDLGKEYRKVSIK